MVWQYKASYTQNHLKTHRKREAASSQSLYAGMDVRMWLVFSLVVIA